MTASDFGRELQEAGLLDAFYKRAEHGECWVYNARRFQTLKLPRSFNAESKELALEFHNRTNQVYLISMEDELDYEAPFKTPNRHETFLNWVQRKILP